MFRHETRVGRALLLKYVAGRAADSGYQVTQAAAVQSEIRLVFAGPHQLCAPWLSRPQRLPVPQRRALATAFGLSAGSPPDRLLAGLAVFSLPSEVAGDRPLIGLADDAQWLDRASAQVQGFVARAPTASSRSERSRGWAR